MAAGLYSMRSAILRIETFWKPSATKSSRAASRMARRDRLAVAFLSFFDTHE